MRLKLVWALALGGVVLAAQAWAQDKLVILANPQGSVNYAQALAIAKVLSDKAGMATLVSGSSGPQIWLNQIDSGEGQLGMPNAVDAMQAQEGKAPNYRKPLKNLRLVSVTYSFFNGVVTPVASGITRLEQARGQRVAGGYVAHQTCLDISTAQLASVGLGWTDVKMVPVQSSAAGGEALKAGRVDVNPCAPTTQAILQETNVTKPLRFISIGHDAAAQQRFRRHFPTGRPVLVPKGTSFGIVEDTWVWQYDFYLVTGKQVPDERIHAITQTLWNGLADLRNIQPDFKSMDQAKMADASATFNIPYHPGAIRFYKERGAWNAAMDARQTAILGQIGER
jgi:TRAP transporter TAXI family solute receptor